MTQNKEQLHHPLPMYLTIPGRLTALALAAGLPFFFLTLYYIHYYLEDTAAKVQDRALSRARQISAKIDNHIETTGTLLAAVGKAVSPEPDAIESNESLFQAIKAELPVYFNNIKLNAPDGSSLGSSSGLRIAVDDREYFHQALRKHGLAVGEPVVSRSNGAWTLGIARPVFDDTGDVAAVISASTHLSRLQELLDASNLPDSTVVTVLDVQGRVLARSLAPEQWIGKDLSHWVMASLPGGEGVREVIAADNIQRLSGYVTCSQVPWLVFVGIPSEIAYADMRQAQRFSVLLGLLAIFGVVLLAWRIGRGITRPIYQLAADAQVFGKGNLQHRTVVQSRSEIGVLADTFNQMATRVEKSVGTLAESEERLGVTLKSIGDAVIVTDRQGAVTFMNPVAQQLTVWSESEAAGRPLAEVFQIVNEDTGQIVEDPTARVYREGIVVGLANHTVLLTRDGRRLAIEDSGAPVRDVHNDVIGAVLVFHDVSERRAAEKEIKRQQELLQTVFDHIPIMVALYDGQGDLQLVNRNWQRVLGWSLDEARTLDILAELYPDPDYRRSFIDFTVQASTDWVDFKTRARDGRLIDTAWAHVRLSDGSDISIGQDISERKAYEKELKRQANYDSLTQLPNRNLLRDRLYHAIARARRFQQSVAVLFLDLDRFKTVNDSLGHSIGDELLQATAKRLRDHLRDADTLARVGGDEFVIVLEDLHEIGQLDVLAKKLLGALEDSFNVQDYELFIRASIGVSIFPRDGLDVQTLMKNADVALYRAKSQGRNRVQFYTSTMNFQAVERLSLESDLRYALAREELSVHYQPQISFASGRITGVEALLRWKHPQRGMISPGEFIPLAEETGLITTIGEWVLTTACTQTKRWQDEAWPNLTIAVNVSPLQLMQPGFTDRVVAILDQTGLDPGRLVIEIVENSLINDVERTLVVLKSLKDVGIQLAIDDFGTGYSSLTYLKRFPFDWLKIDRSFVHDLVQDTDDAELVFAIIAMARNLKLKTVAEGVENENQLAILQGKKCDEMQGFYFSPPMPAEDITVLLRDNRKLDSVAGKQ